MPERAALTIVGIGDGGCLDLSSRAVNAVQTAAVLAGGARHLEFFPQFSGEKIALDGGLKEILDRLEELSLENNVCVLASGDPLFYGIGGLLIKKMGVEHVEIIPHPSSVQWAFARAGLSWNEATFISLHARKLFGFVSRLRNCSLVACLTDPDNTPPRIAAHMLRYGERDWEAIVCENLGGVDERVRRFELEELSRLEDVRELNVLILRRKTEGASAPVVPFLKEELFAKKTPKKGLITSREIRTLSLAALRLRPDSVVWDIGAGSGSVAIEAALIAPRGRVCALEVDPEGVEICRRNVETFGADNVEVIAGRAPEALAELPDPDAVFVGGSKGSLEEIIAVCLERLRSGGRLVVNAVTLDNVGAAYRAFRAHDIQPELFAVNVSRGAPLAGYMRYEALNPIHIFAADAPSV